MKTSIFLTIGALLLAGCGSPGPVATGAEPDRWVLGSLESHVLGCGTVTGTGDSHPGDGKFYELTVRAEREPGRDSGTIVLYVMNDVLFGTNPVPEPEVHRGTVERVSIGKDQARLKGHLADGRPFTLEVEDRVTDAISDGPQYDYFSFSAPGLEVQRAFIHEGDLVVTEKRCE